MHRANANENLMVENVTKIENGIIINVDERVENIIYVEKLCLESCHM